MLNLKLKNKMFVKCIKGFPGVLEEEQIYEVERVTSAGNFILVETPHPSPHTSFNKDRFEPVDIDRINFEDAFEVVMEL
jgi:hypothetical protein